MIGPGIEVDDSGLITWVNDAYQAMLDAVGEINPDYLTKAVTTDLVANQQEYLLPSDFDRVLMLNLKYDATWVKAWPLPTINGIPVAATTDSTQGFTVDVPAYYIVGQNVGIMPIPDASVADGMKLWYVYTPAELTADSDEPSLPAKYHHILKYGAYANYLDQDDEHVAAENMRRRFDARVEQLVEAMSQNQVDEPKSVQITNTDGLYVDELGDW